MNTPIAVILARGLGTRMRRADAEAALAEEQARVADTGVKAMIPIGRPFLDYVLSGLADAGIADVCLVIGPEQLPAFAREAGKWLGRLRRFMHATRQEFERELRLGDTEDLTRKISDIDLLRRDAPDKDPDLVLKSHKPEAPGESGISRPSS